ncbi:MAG: ABC transporter permease [Methanomassiliicoccales archaeon]
MAQQHKFEHEPLLYAEGGYRRSRLNQFLASIYVNALYEMKNYPVVLLNTMMSPVSFLILIIFVSRGRLIGEAIEGGLIMSMFSAGTSLLTDLSHLKNDFKVQDMVVSSPASWQIYVLGMAASEIVYTLPALVLLGILAFYFVHISIFGLLTLLAVLIMMFVTSIAIGYTFATFSTDIVQSFAFSRLISTLFSTLPPVYYPIYYIPYPIRYFAYLSPTTYAALLAQHAAGFVNINAITYYASWAILIAVTLVLFAIAWFKGRWREN